MSKLLSFLLNKYLLIFLVFSVWMLFFDSNSIFTHNKLNQEIKTLKKQKEFLKDILTEEKSELTEITNNPSKLKKIAREKYYFSKENEDIFIIKPKESN